MKRLLFLFILLLFLVSCSKLDSVGYDVGEKLGKKIIGQKDPIDTTCIDQAQQLISSTVVIYNLTSLFLKTYTFSDGTTVSTSVRYGSGTKKGENINYFYPRNILEDNGVLYRKQIIADDGTISGTRQFRARLVLAPTGQDVPVTDKRYPDATAELYTVKDAIITNCQWI